MTKMYKINLTIIYYNTITLSLNYVIMKATRATWEITKAQDISTVEEGLGGLLAIMEKNLWAKNDICLRIRQILEKIEDWKKLSGNDKNYLGDVKKNLVTLQKNSTHNEELEWLHVDTIAIVDNYIKSILLLVNQPRKIKEPVA